MNKILSLDIENVFVIDANLFLYPERYAKSYRAYTLPRDHSEYFLKECQNIFNQIILNTSVREDKAREVMRRLGLSDCDYHHWDGISKMVGLEKLVKDNLLIHVEDGMTKGDYKLAEILGINHIDVIPYDRPKRKDKELLRVLKKIRLCSQFP